MAGGIFGLGILGGPTDPAGGMKPGGGILGGPVMKRLGDFIGSDRAMAMAQGFMTPGVGTAGAFSTGLAGYGAVQKQDKKRAAINAWLKARGGKEALPPEMAQYIAEDPDLAGKLMLSDMTKEPAKVTPYTDPGKLKSDLDAGLITPEQYTAGLNPPPDPTKANMIFDNKAKLRTEYTNASKDYVAMRDSYSRLEAASKDNTGASDIAMVYGFMKMLDPTSVVREGEFATAANAGGIPERVIAMYNNVVKGEKLAPEIRQQFIQQGRRQFEAASVRHKAITEEYKRLSGSFGFDPAETILDLSGGVNPPPAMPGPAGGAPPGVEPDVWGAMTEEERALWK